MSDPLVGRKGPMLDALQSARRGDKVFFFAARAVNLFVGFGDFGTVVP
jgi:hypothetical protein